MGELCRTHIFLKRVDTSSAPARREGCCLFVTYQWGNPQAPINRDLRDIVSPKGQSLLCVPCGFVIYGKQREILKIARLFKGLILGEKPFF
ncbi:MAG: hypothetical protein R6T98_14155 [Desulfatiglandales bacterium]